MIHRSIARRCGVLISALVVGVVSLAARRPTPPRSNATATNPTTTVSIAPSTTLNITEFPGGPVGGPIAAQLRVAHSDPPSGVFQTCTKIISIHVSDSRGELNHKNFDGNGMCSFGEGDGTLTVVPFPNDVLFAACDGKFTQPATSVTKTHTFTIALWANTNPSTVWQGTTTITAHIACAPGPVTQRVFSVTLRDTVEAQPGGACPARYTINGFIAADLRNLGNSVLTARWEWAPFNGPNSVGAEIGQQDVEHYITAVSAHMQNGVTATVRLHVLTPNDMASAPVTLQAHCTQVASLRPRIPQPTTVLVPKHVGNPVAKPSAIPVKRPSPVKRPNR